jgi:predicted ATPase
MITRFYANNYRCLVAFEINFDPMAVFCGINGTGKSSVFDAIKFVRDLATGNCFLGGSENSNNRTVSQLEFTHWLKSDTQEFELDLESDGYHFRYLIHLEHIQGHEPRIKKEQVFCDERELYNRDLDGVHFDNSGSGFPLDWRQAALASIHASPKRGEIESLQKALSSLLIIRPGVHGIEHESKAESFSPNLDLSNLISWYRHLAQDQEYTDLLRESLRAVWPDFKFLRLVDAGMSVKALELAFEEEDLLFGQLSDGEKMLIGLYLVHTVLRTGNVTTVLIDEPDNFVSLQEIQPWLLSISELIDNRQQVLIISHNSEILDNNPSRAFLFKRDNHRSPARCTPLDIPGGLNMREALARGWVN